jgi:hypothetical protein
MKQELNRTLFLFKNYVEHVPKANLDKMVPGVARGIYVLFQESNNKKMDVVYIGRSIGASKQGIGARLRYHRDKKDNWSHFSVLKYAKMFLTK